MLVGQLNIPFLVVVDESLHDFDVDEILVLHVDHLTLLVLDFDHDYVHYYPVVADFVAKDQHNIVLLNM